MYKFRKHVKELITVTVLVSLAVSIVNAVVFVYYPVAVGFEEGRALLFKKGTNAGMADLDDTIIVYFEKDKGVSVVTHPSKRGVTYYKDLVRIVNVNTHACNITFMVDNAFQDPVKEAQLILIDVITSLVIRVVDLKKAGARITLLLDAGSEVRMDLRFVISSNTEGSETALIQIAC